MEIADSVSLRFVTKTPTADVFDGTQRSDPLRGNEGDDAIHLGCSRSGWIHVEKLSRAVNMIQLVPVIIDGELLMGGWGEAKSRQSNEKQMATTFQIQDEARQSASMARQFSA